MTPVTFSVSLPNLKGSSAGHLPEPSLSSFRDELKSILSSGLEGSTPANYAFSMRQAFSNAELSLALKTDVQWGSSSVGAMFSFDQQQTKTRLIADFVQSYYTVDVDAPLKPSAFFKPEVTLDEIDDFMNVENPPMYVQSITYGRRAIFSIETATRLGKPACTRDRRSAHRYCRSSTARTSGEYLRLAVVVYEVRAGGVRGVRRLRSRGVGTIRVSTAISRASILPWR